MAEEQLPAGLSFVTEADGIREYKLANGMKVLLVENRVAPVATFCVLYRVGSRNEAVGYTGATHLLEHMMFKGTPDFNKERNTQIAATLQKIGADFNATTWYDRTNYFQTVPSDHLELAVRLEADRIRRRRLRRRRGARPHLEVLRCAPFGAGGHPRGLHGGAAAAGRAARRGAARG